MTKDPETAETPEQQTARLKQFVLDWCDGKIFSNLHLRRPEDIGRHFTVLMLGGAELVPKDAVVVYEHMSEAMERSINGGPMFLSCRFLTRDEWARVRPAIEAEEARRKAIEV